MIVVFISLLFLGIHSNECILANERVATLHPSISSDQISISEQGYVSTFQTSTPDPYYAESAFLYIGTAGSTIYDTDYLKSIGGGDHQISSQDFNTITANDRIINVNGGYEDGYSYHVTNTYGDESHIIYPHRDYTSENVSYEYIIYGTTTGVENATIFDGVYENITEENRATGGEGWPFGQGPSDNTDSELWQLWMVDGELYKVGKGKTMHINEWYVGNIQGEIETVNLSVTYKIKEDSFKGTQYFQYRKGGSGIYFNTDIQPWATDDIMVTENSTIYEKGSPNNNFTINSVGEIETLDVKYWNDGDHDVKIDRIWLVITVSGTEYMLNVEQDITAVPDTFSEYELWIYGNYTTGAQEQISVEVLNSTGNWEDLGPFQCVDSAGWNVYTLNKSKHLTGLGTNTVSIQYRDATLDEEQTTISIDIVEVRAYSDPASYDFDMYYVFNWAETGNEKNISIYDVRSGNQDIDLYIRDFDGNQWVSLSPNVTSIEGAYTNHTYLLSSNIGSYISGSNEIWIRYNETDSSSSASLNVDYVGVNIHSVAGINQQTDIVYDFEDFPGDRTTVTQIRALDYSFVNDSSVNVDVQLFNYESNQWVSSGDPAINDTSPTFHVWTFSLSPGDLISPNPGNILVRYSFSDNVPVTLSIDYLRVEITYTTEDGNGAGGGTGGGDGGGGEGGTNLPRLSASIVYPDKIEKFSVAQIDIILTSEKEEFVSDANVTLTIYNGTEPLITIEKMEEESDHYTALLKTDTLETGNYTFTVWAQKSGFTDFISSAFPFRILVSYPFLTLIQHSSYIMKVIDNPTSLLLDPTFYVIPSLIVLGVILQITTFAAIDPKKLRSIYIFTPDGQGIYYRTFGKERIDSQLTTAALSGIISLIMEATSSKKPTNTIDQATFDIFLEYGRTVTIATFIEKRTLNKRKIRKGQKQLVEKVEEKYEHIIADWDGNLSYFFEIDQLVFDAFDFKVTKDLSKLIFDVAHIQEELSTLYASQDKFHLCGKALWNAYDLYSRIKSPRKPFVLESWKALEKGYLIDYLASNSVFRSKIISKFFAILDFVKTPKILKALFKLRYIIYPEISKELYFLIPPEKITERTDEGI